MMKIGIIALVILIFLAACGGGEYKEAEKLNATNFGVAYKILCIEGIEYLIVHQGMSGHFKPDGSLHTCENEIN